MEKEERIKEIREWINTGLAIVTLGLLIYTIVMGVGELKELNINLDKINGLTVSSLKVDNISGTCLNGTSRGTTITEKYIIPGCGG